MSFREQVNNKVQLIVTNQELNEIVSKMTNHYSIKYTLPMIDSVVLEIRKDLTEQLLSCEFGRQVSKRLEEDSIIQAQMNRASQIIQLDAAREQQLYGEGIGVAVLDTGVYPHPDLIYGGNRITAFCDIVNGRRYAYDDNGHGTQGCSRHSQ